VLGNTAADWGVYERLIKWTGWEEGIPNLCLRKKYSLLIVGKKAFYFLFGKKAFPTYDWEEGIPYL